MHRIKRIPRLTESDPLANSYHSKPWHTLKISNTYVHNCSISFSLKITNSDVIYSYLSIIKIFVKSHNTDLAYLADISISIVIYWEVCGLLSTSLKFPTDIQRILVSRKAT